VRALGRFIQQALLQVLSPNAGEQKHGEAIRASWVTVAPASSSSARTETGDACHAGTRTPLANAARIDAANTP
jgi:hypothetical protein